MVNTLLQLWIGALTLGAISDVGKHIYTPEGAVVISYQDLVSAPLSLGASLCSSTDKAFGSAPQCLGIIIVRDLSPAYITFRERLLKLSYKFAQLKNLCENNIQIPSLWLVAREGKIHQMCPVDIGRNFSKEIMNGKPDTLKGSYYANPVMDDPDVSAALRDAYPEYYSKNIWPKEEAGVEDFETSFKDLGGFIFKVGCELAAACQPFALSHLNDASLSLPQLIGTSKTVKARLLHYFPPSPDSVLPADDEPVDSWCGFHLDHSILTGLCSVNYISMAMFLREGESGVQTVSSPSSASGLYIRTRAGELTKVSIPADCLAFQTGEALEVATGGKLRATPHCVRVGASPDAEKISRETFALFMQPDVDQHLSSSCTFGQFSKKVFDEHYHGVLA
ncbi:Clavaminate synthase-like protein [Mycena sp. CBHHK59/15]|nr:Clavaminate synthase-like protein [Mycena sp. CBHHK59/15]